jgi:uncharacterized protein YegL
MAYNIPATSQTPALIIYLLDVSESMGLSCGESTRISVLNNAMDRIVKTMISRSIRGDDIHSRYRIAMLTYSDKVEDLLGGIKTIKDFVKDRPNTPILEAVGKRTNTSAAFERAKEMLSVELKEIQNCPAPLICHITDGEYNEGPDPTSVAQQIMQMTVPDGNVLIENIFISDNALLNDVKNAKEWEGLTSPDQLKDYAVTLFNMSSQLPESYLVEMQNNDYKNFKVGARMMLPGNNPDLVELGFVMSASTPTTTSRPEISKSEVAEREAARLKEERKVAVLAAREVAEKAKQEKAEREAMELASRRKAERVAEQKAKREREAKELTTRKKAEREAKEKVAIDNTEVKFDIRKNKNLKFSIAGPKLLSKHFESSFLVQIFLPEKYAQVARNIKSEFREQESFEHSQFSKIKLGQKVLVKFFSPYFIFSTPDPKLINSSINTISLSGTPIDNCEIGLHKILISISDVETSLEIESLSIQVRVVDYAFDHFSRPMLSRVSAVVLGVGSFAMFILTFLEQIDKTVGLTSGTAAGVLAAVVYTNFYNLYQRIRTSTP